MVRSSTKHTPAAPNSLRPGVRADEVLAWGEERPHSRGCRSLRRRRRPSGGDRREERRPGERSGYLNRDRHAFPSIATSFINVRPLAGASAIRAAAGLGLVSQRKGVCELRQGAVDTSAGGLLREVLGFAADGRQQPHSGFTREGALESSPVCRHHEQGDVRLRRTGDHVLDGHIVEGAGKFRERLGRIPGGLLTQRAGLRRPMAAEACRGRRRRRSRWVPQGRPRPR